MMTNESSCMNANSSVRLLNIIFDSDATDEWPS